MKQEILDTINETARKMLDKNLMQAALNGTNFYSATESLLRIYKTLMAQIDNAEEYEFIPPRKSKDITSYNGGEGMMPDWREVQDEAIRERMRSYVRTQAQFDNIDRLIRPYEDNPYFIVIRMYYFNEDADGNDLPSDGRHRTMEDIANELEAAGFQYARSDKTLAKKRTEIVRDMTVALFGEAGAVSIEMYKARRKGEEHERDN